jgi:cbb3-type cytochrome oxidase maturation protein
VEIIYLLLPASIALAAIALCGYLWAARSGQFDDLDTPARRVLTEEEEDSSPDQKVDH